MLLLLLDYTITTAYLRLPEIKVNDSFNCTYEVIEDMDHIFFMCDNYQAQSSELYLKLSKTKLQTPFW